MLRQNHAGNIQNEVTLEEHEGVLNAKRTYSVPRALRRDVVDASTEYLGEAIVGSVTSDAVWRIQKFTKTGGNITSITFADGNAEFDNVWDDRISLDYS